MPRSRPPEEHFTKRIATYVTQEIGDHIRAIAQDQRISEAQVLRQIIDEFFTIPEETSTPKGYVKWADVRQDVLANRSK